MKTTVLLVLSLCAALTVSQAKTHFLRALMDGAQANAGNGTGSPGTGVAYVTYDDASNELTWDISWEGLDGAPTAMHFHGPAEAGQNAGVAQGIGVGSNPAVGSAAITAARGQQLLDGLWYVNLHTSTAGGGEIRGQVLRADLDDDFSGDLSQWEASTRGLENNAPAGYDPAEIVDGELVLGGITTSQYWYGNSLESVADFDSRLATEISVKRVSLEGSGTAWRSTLWILGDDGHYLHYSQNVGETGWQWNARDDGGAGTLLPTGSGNNIASLDGLDADPGQFEMGMRIEPRGPNMIDVTMLHDGVEVATHSFTNFPTFFKVILTGQARAPNDAVSAVFDDLVVFQEFVENLAPGFLTDPLEKSDATVNTPYSDTLEGDVIDPEEDPITFAKTGGPEWLQVAENGALGGTPSLDDTGLNEFTVSVTDGESTSEATVFIRVIDPNAKPTGNLFAWWPCNDGAGSIIADISGNGRDATITNGDTGGLAPDGSVWREDPECGMVASFSGDDAAGAYAQMPGTLPQFSTDPDNGFTWSFWANSEGPVNNDIILGNRWDANGVGFSPLEFTKFNTDNFEWHVDPPGAQHIDYAVQIQPGLGWMHHAVVKDGDQITYYRDGVEAGSRSITSAHTNPQPFFFAGQSAGERWQGSLFDIRLFDDALSADDIFTVFSNKGVFSGQAGLEFTDIQLDADRNLTLTWRSRNNATYALDFSTGLLPAGQEGGWNEIDDGIDSQGESTTVTLTPDDLPFLVTEPDLFFKVSEIE